MQIDESPILNLNKNSINGMQTRLY
jgi:hypothetical protein